MIEIKNLCKKYEDDSGTVLALNNVNLSLPTKGMVFIVGKSGCGKTTLLNILGGLDNLTSGDILINNKSLNNFSIRDLDNYRNTTVGFVFQDFCLIDRMSVIDNIKMSLEFQDNIKYVNYSELLRKFGLSGLGRRKPSQLSAGQKQRVAIARAIVKNPEIILADEPTGNVDEKTSVQIMDILKEISKDKLVLVISHNNDEANKYGDRIIEMSDGCIINDKSINNASSKRIEIKNNEIILPGSGDLSVVDFDMLNRVVQKSEGNIKISQNDELFNSQKIKEDYKNIELKEAKMSGKTKLKFASFFFRKKFIFNLFIILLITFVTSFFSIVEILGFVRNNFEINRMINEAGFQQFILSPYKSPHILHKLDDRGIEEKALSYDVEIDPIINVAIPTGPQSKSSFTYGISAQRFYSTDYTSSKSIQEGYTTETTGVMITSLDKLKFFFGDFSILAGEIKETGDGVIITDYVADSILELNSSKYSSYQEIIDGGYINNRLEVDAIIKTDAYKKFPNLFTNWDNYKNNISAKNLLVSQYSCTFSLNPNFREDYLKNYKTHDNVFFSGCSFDFVSSKGLPYKGSYPGITLLDDLKVDEIHMNYSTFNAFFGTKYNSKNLDTFKEETVASTFTDTDGNIVFSKTFRITKLYTKDFYSDTVHMSKSNYDDFADHFIFTYGYSVDTRTGRPYDFINYYSTLENEDELLHSVNRSCHMAYAVVELFSAFKGVFKFISYLLIAAIFLIIVLNANTLIKHNVYEIGLMKAFGAKTRDLVAMFTAQMVFSSLIVCFLLYNASEIFIYYADILLKNGVIAYTSSSKSYLNFHTFVFLDGYFYINISLVAAATILSVIVPIVAIRKIKPLTIIRTKN